MFGSETVELAKNQFGCNDYAQGDDRFRWMLVQTEAACDHAQHKPGNLPYSLALEMPAAPKRPEKGLSQALWCSPVFNLNGRARRLNAYSRFQLYLTLKDVAAVHSSYRIREELLSDFIHKIHTQGMRPGVISFKEQKTKNEPAESSPAAAKPSFWERLWGTLAKWIRSKK